MKSKTLVAHAGFESGQILTDISPSLHMSVTFENSNDNKSKYFYSVFDNPNRRQLETALAKLEQGNEAIVFSSGSAAIASIFATCKPNNHIILPTDVFQGTARLLNDNFKQWGLKFSFIDMSDLVLLEKSITKETKIIWIESPSNPLMRLTNFESIVSIAKKYDIITICDNTYMPYIQSPLGFGIDGVLYSTTKYISGHNDVVGGVFISKEENTLSQQIRKFQQNFGAVQSPFESWLTLRGLKTLPLRIEAQSTNALKIVAFLENQKQILKVNYPTTSSLFKELKKSGQLKEHFGGMISFELDENYISASRFLHKLKIFMNATSFGGTMSLIENRSKSPIQNIGKGTGINLPSSLIRMSVGIEDVSDLIEDLEQALNGSSN